MIPYHNQLFLLTLVACLFLGTASSSGQDKPAVDQMLQFARDLQQRQMYFQAIMEFERVGFYSSNPDLKLQAMLMVGNSYFLAEQFHRAVDSYRLALEYSSKEEYEHTIRLNMAAALGERARMARDTGDLLAAVDNLVTLSEGASDIEATFGAFHLARFSLVLGQYEEAIRYSRMATRSCHRIHSPMCQKARELEQKLSAPGPKRKHPGLGLALSMVLPGAGTLYSEHYFDSLFYFLGTSAAGLMAWDVYDERRSFGDQKPTFFVILGIGVAVYVANVVQGWVSTERLNVSRQHRYIKQINSTRLAPLGPDSL